MIKKIASIFMLLIVVFAVSACGQSSETVNSTASNVDTKNEGKTLIVYFSWSSSENTKKMAEFIQQQTRADILQIEPEVPYTTDYDELGKLAKVERDENARPKIANLPSSLKQYDKIIIGYPIWWHTAPMIIGTFLENYDLTDVNIYPFAQSASMDKEQFNNSMDFVRNSAKNATVHDGLFAKPSDVSTIVQYLKDNKLAK